MFVCFVCGMADHPKIAPSSIRTFARQLLHFYRYLCSSQEKPVQIGMLLSSNPQLWRFGARKCCRQHMLKAQIASAIPSIPFRFPQLLWLRGKLRTQNQEISWETLMFGTFSLASKSSPKTSQTEHVQLPTTVVTREILMDTVGGHGLYCFRQKVTTNWTKPQFQTFNIPKHVKQGMLGEDEGKPWIWWVVSSIWLGMPSYSNLDAP